MKHTINRINADHNEAKRAVENGDVATAKRCLKRVIGQCVTISNMNIDVDPTWFHRTHGEAQRELHNLT